MNTKIIKKIAKSNSIPDTHNTFMVKDGRGIVLSLATGYYFTPPDFIDEEGIYRANYLTDSVAIKTEQPVKSYPEFNTDDLTTDIQIEVTASQIRELLKFVSKDTDRPQLTGVTVYIHDGYAKLIATDGYAMAWESADVYGESIASNYVLSSEFLTLAAMLNKYLEIHINKDYAWVKVGDKLLFGKNIKPITDEQLEKLKKAAKFTTTAIKRSWTKIPSGMDVDLKNNNLITPENGQKVKINIFAARSNEEYHISIEYYNYGIIIMPLRDGDSKAVLSHIQLKKLKKAQAWFYYNPDESTPVFIHYVN